MLRPCNLENQLKAPPAIIAAPTGLFVEVEWQKNDHRRIVDNSAPRGHSAASLPLPLEYSNARAHAVRVFFLQPVRDCGAPGGPDYHRDHLHAAGMGSFVEAALCGE